MEVPKTRTFLGQIVSNQYHNNLVKIDENGKVTAMGHLGLPHDNLFLHNLLDKIPAKVYELRNLVLPRKEKPEDSKLHQYAKHLTDHVHNKLNGLFKQHVKKTIEERKYGSGEYVIGNGIGLELQPLIALREYV